MEVYFIVNYLDEKDTKETKVFDEIIYILKVIRKEIGINSLIVNSEG